MRVTVLTNWHQGTIAVWLRGPTGERTQCLTTMQTRTVELQQQIRAGLVDPLPSSREMDRMAQDLVTMLGQLGHDAILECLT